MIHCWPPYCCMRMGTGRGGTPTPCLETGAASPGMQCARELHKHRISTNAPTEVLSSQPICITADTSKTFTCAASTHAVKVHAHGHVQPCLLHECDCKAGVVDQAVAAGHPRFSIISSSRCRQQAGNKVTLSCSCTRRQCSPRRSPPDCAACLSCMLRASLSRFTGYQQLEHVLTQHPLKMPFSDVRQHVMLYWQ